jgi:hypothetical protein
VVDAILMPFFAQTLALMSLSFHRFRERQLLTIGEESLRYLVLEHEMKAISMKTFAFLIVVSHLKVVNHILTCF